MKTKEFDKRMDAMGKLLDSAMDLERCWFNQIDFNLANGLGNQEFRTGGCPKTLRISNMHERVKARITLHIQWCRGNQCLMACFRHFKLMPFQWYDLLRPQKSKTITDGFLNMVGMNRALDECSQEMEKESVFPVKTGGLSMGL